MAYALSLSVDQDLLALGRAVGELRRRNLKVSGITLGPGADAGQARLTVIVDADEGAADAARAANVGMLLVPDQHGRAVYEQDVAPAIVPGKALMFAHGFNVHFKQIVPPEGVDVSMVAPKSPGHLVRSEFQAGRGVPALVAGGRGARRPAPPRALPYPAGVGRPRARRLPTPLRAGAESGLFGEP